MRLSLDVPALWLNMACHQIGDCLNDFRSRIIRMRCQDLAALDFQFANIAFRRWGANREAIIFNRKSRRLRPVAFS